MPRTVRVLDIQRDGQLYRLTLSRSAAGVNVEIEVREIDVEDNIPTASRVRLLDETELTAIERQRLADIFNTVEARIKQRLYS